jgi:hypothetical protein
MIRRGKNLTKCSEDDFDIQLEVPILNGKLVVSGAVGDTIDVSPSAR